MAGRRHRKEDKPKPWVVGFAGSSGSTNKANVCELLDTFLPDDQEWEGLLPNQVKRTQKSLMYVWNWLDGYAGEDEEPYEPFKYEVVPLNAIIPTLLAKKDNGHEVYLVLAFDEDKDYELAETAMDAGIAVKSLDDGLDDLQIGEPEAKEEPEEEKPAPRRQRGKPRQPKEEAEVPWDDQPVVTPTAVQAEVDGPATVAIGLTPATVVVEGVTPSDQTAAPALSAKLTAELGVALYNFVVEIIEARLQNLPLPPNTTITFHGAAVKAFTNEDGEYELAGDRKRAPRGWRAVELTHDEAQEAGLV